MPEVVGVASANLGCHGQCEMGATPGMLPSYLCNSMCCAMLLQSIKECTSVHIYIYILDAQVGPYGANLCSTLLICGIAYFELERRMLIS